MTKKKGEYGYRKYFKIKNGIIIGFFVFIILLLFISSKLTKNADISRILLVSSILTDGTSYGKSFVTFFGGI